MIVPPLVDAATLETLFEPRSGVLPPGIECRFDLCVPGAAAVTVRQGAMTTRLERQGDRFTGSFRPVAGDLYICKLDETSFTREVPLLSFKVTDPGVGSR